MSSAATSPATPAPSPGLGKAFGTKTYVVLQKQFRGPGDKRPNVKIIAVKLTHAAAHSIKDATPGTWIERHDADKVHLTAEVAAPVLAPLQPVAP